MAVACEVDYCWVWLIAVVEVVMVVGLERAVCSEGVEL